MNLPEKRRGIPVKKKGSRIRGFKGSSEKQLIHQILSKNLQSKHPFQFIYTILRAKKAQIKKPYIEYRTSRHTDWRAFGVHRKQKIKSRTSNIEKQGTASLSRCNDLFCHLRIDPTKISFIKRYYTICFSLNSGI